MNREDIIAMAQEAGGFLGEVPRGDAWMFTEEAHLEHFAALVASAEREACAKVCEGLLERPSGYQGTWEGYGKFKTQMTGQECATAIRARGNVATNDTSQERVDETTKQRHD